jgi:transposase
MCTCGKCRPRCGSEITERLRYIPQEILVEQHIYWKYGECKCNHPDKDILKGVITAPREARILPGSIATPSLLAHIFVSKFADSMPYYRQSKRFERDKIFISRQNMCNWTIKVSVQLQGLMDLLHQYTLSGPLINIDETPLQVLKEPGRSPTSKSYVWVLYGGPPDKKAVYFKYAPSRSGKIAKELLGEYSGCVQSDDYGAYVYLNSEYGIIHITCMAHVRRKFIDLQEALKALPGGKKTQKKANNTDKIIRLIQKLYKLERKYRKEGSVGEELLLKRQEEAKPVFEELKEMVSGLIPKVPPKSTLGMALLYAQKNLPLIEQYLELPYVSLDNNDVENKLRLFVQGRRNWLFSYNAAGANATTTFYSLIQTAKINGLNPYHYLKYIFEKLPFIESDDQLKALLPMELTPEMISE